MRYLVGLGGPRIALTYVVAVIEDSQSPSSPMQRESLCKVRRACTSGCHRPKTYEYPSNDDCGVPSLVSQFTDRVDRAPYTLQHLALQSGE